MKYIFFKYNIFLFLLFVIGCSSTQSSMYNPDDGSSGWNVKVIRKASVIPKFVCTINDSTIVTSSFKGENFEKTGQYRGKKVMMNGYSKSNDITIRVFIDDVLVAHFDF